MADGRKPKIFEKIYGSDEWSNVVVVCVCACARICAAVMSTHIHQYFFDIQISPRARKLHDARVLCSAVLFDSFVI